MEEGITQTQINNHFQTVIQKTYGVDVESNNN